MRKFMNIIKQYILTPVKNGFEQGDSFPYFVASFSIVVLTIMGVLFMLISALPWWAALGIIFVSLLVLVNYLNGREGD
jgi:hypothetical protein